MNDLVPFAIEHILAEGPWPCQDIHCDPISATEAVHSLESARVNERWAIYKARHPLAFDGPMTGLARIEERSPRTLTLLVKRTSYAEYVATREPAFTAMHPGIERANPIGMTIVIISVDYQVVVTWRSAASDQNAGLPYFIGGYLEPAPQDNSPCLVCDNLAREAAEELSLDLSPPVFVTGLASDPTFCHPEIFAVARVPLTAEEIPARWRSAHSRDEASSLALLPLRDILSRDARYLFPGGVTWSFAAAAWLLNRCWNNIEEGLFPSP